MLMEEAERIAREEHGSEKLAVISGVGTRHYYRKLGYELEGTYMVKTLESKILHKILCKFPNPNFTRGQRLLTNAEITSRKSTFLRPKNV